jgi:hypothetical protein
MSREKIKKKLTEWVSHIFDWLSSGQEIWGVPGVQEHGGTSWVRGECKLTFGKELDYSQIWSFGVAKHFPHLSTINRGYITSF